MKPKAIIMAAAMLPLLFSCQDEPLPATKQTAKVSVSVELEGLETHETKSSFSWSDTYIHDYEIFLVNPQTGKVESCTYQTGTSSVDLTAVKGKEYFIYALVNHGSRLTPASVDELSDLSLDVSHDRIKSNGIPMSGSVSYVIPSGSGQVVVPVTRLLARIDFRVDRSYLKHADEEDGFVVNGVAIRDAMTSFSPFLSNNRQTKTSGIDYGFDEASTTDLATVNAGGKISLYVFENMQGNLLSGNSDPWSKVPSKVNGYQKCSYLEVTASYCAQGLMSDDITYRMFLGSNASSNFDIKRNTIYTITLRPTEDEIMGERGSWKIVSRDWDDMRTMAFMPSSLTVPSMGSASAVLYMDPEPFDVTIDDVAWLSKIGCSYSYDKATSTITVTNRERLSKDELGFISATSWDGLWDAVLQVTVKAAKVPSSITIAPSPITLKVGGSQTLTATVTYSDGTSSQVTPTYTCANTSIASVNGSKITGVAPGSTTVGATYSENGKSVAAPPVKVTVTQNASLKPSSATIDTWGGNSYPVTFTYTNANGVSSTVTPTLTSLTCTGGAPGSIIAYSGGQLIAADWWGKSGSWVTASPMYTATFTYSGLTTTVTGTMHGFTGFKSASISDGYYTTVTSSPSVYSAVLTGSEDRDVRSKATAAVTGTNSKNYVGSYLKVGKYGALISVTDPTNGKTRTKDAEFSVLTNIKNVSCVLRIGNFSYLNGSGYDNTYLYAGDGDELGEIYVNTNGHDETMFDIRFADFSYTDVWGNSQKITSIVSPNYGYLPPLTTARWGVMPLDDDTSEYTLNGFTFTFHMVAR